MIDVRAVLDDLAEAVEAALPSTGTGERWTVHQRPAVLREEWFPPAAFLGSPVIEYRGTMGLDVIRLDLDLVVATINDDEDLSDPYALMSDAPGSFLVTLADHSSAVIDGIDIRTASLDDEVELGPNLYRVVTLPVELTVP